MTECSVYPGILRVHLLPTVSWRVFWCVEKTGFYAQVTWEHTTFKFFNTQNSAWHVSWCQVLPLPFLCFLEDLKMVHPSPVETGSQLVTHSCISAEHTVCCPVMEGTMGKGERAGAGRAEIQYSVFSELVWFWNLFTKYLGAGVMGDLCLSAPWTETPVLGLQWSLQLSPQAS